MRAVGPGDRSNKDKVLEPFGQHGAGHARHAPANVVEAAAAAQDFPHDQKRPPAAQHFVGARNGAELSISRHVGSLARRAGQCGTDSGPGSALRTIHEISDTSFPLQLSSLLRSRHQHCKNDRNEKQRWNVADQMTAFGPIGEGLRSHDGPNNMLNE